MKICGLCGKEFKILHVIEGKVRNLGGRKYCLECSPWGSHNTRVINTRVLASKVSDDDFINIIKSSSSLAGALEGVGLKNNGGNGARVKERIALLGIETNHFLSNTDRGRQRVKKNLKEILVPDSGKCNGWRLKKYLIRENLIINKCKNCGNEGEWMGIELSLQLHHVNGDRCDNSLDNLVLLCPNCHAQTDNFAGKALRSEDFGKKFFCTRCNKELSSNTRTKMCRSCAAKTRIQPRKVENRPEKEELLRMVEKQGYKGTGRLFGVTDNTIRKWLK